MLSSHAPNGKKEVRLKNSIHIPGLFIHNRGRRKAKMLWQENALLIPNQLEVQTEL